MSKKLFTKVAGAGSVSHRENQATELTHCSPITGRGLFLSGRAKSKVHQCEASVVLLQHVFSLPVKDENDPNLERTRLLTRRFLNSFQLDVIRSVSESVTVIYFGLIQYFTKPFKPLQLPPPPHFGALHLQTSAYLLELYMIDQCKK